MKHFIQYESESNYLDEHGNTLANKHFILVSF